MTVARLPSALEPVSPVAVIAFPKRGMASTANEIMVMDSPCRMQSMSHHIDPAAVRIQHQIPMPAELVAGVLCTA